MSEHGLREKLKSRKGKIEEIQEESEPKKPTPTATPTPTPTPSGEIKFSDDERIRKLREAHEANMQKIKDAREVEFKKLMEKASKIRREVTK